MSVQSQIDRIKEEVSSQSELIAQIKTALQNKVGSSETVEAVTVGVSVPAMTSFSFELVQDGVVVPGGVVLSSAFSNTWSLQKGSFCYIFPAKPLVDPTWTIKTSGDVELLANAELGKCATFKVNGAGSITISE